MDVTSEHNPNNRISHISQPGVNELCLPFHNSKKVRGSIQKLAGTIDKNIMNSCLACLDQPSDLIKLSVLQKINANKLQVIPKEIDDIFLNWLDLVESSEKIIEYLMLTNIRELNDTLSISLCSIEDRKIPIALKKIEGLKKFHASPVFTLETYLIKPMQRLTKLRIHFKRVYYCHNRLIVDDYSSVYGDTSSLNQSVNDISEICLNANEAAKWKENEYLGRWLGTNVLNPHKILINKNCENEKPRKLLYHGILKLVEKKKDVRCFLFTDIFIICKCSDENLRQDLLSRERFGDCMHLSKKYLNVKDIIIQKSFNDKLAASSETIADTWIV
ncbi:hypothetical protein HZS_3925, partial [Henneguya salminicola]